jgi:hypothetical protein
VWYLDEWVAPDHRGEVAAEIGGRVEELRWAIATLLGETERTWFVAAPLSVGVTALDPTAGDAVVEVWIVTVFSREGLGAPETRFLLETAELRWASGRWLITGLTLEPGPSVGLALDEVPISAAALDEVLSAHELIGPEVGP